MMCQPGASGNPDRLVTFGALTGIAEWVVRSKER
jgi:hypothetical protein